MYLFDINTKHSLGSFCISLMNTARIALVLGITTCHCEHLHYLPKATNWLGLETVLQPGYVFRVPSKTKLLHSLKH